MDARDGSIVAAAQHSFASSNVFRFCFWAGRKAKFLKHVSSSSKFVGGYGDWRND